MFLSIRCVSLQLCYVFSVCFFFLYTAPSDIYSLSLHDALPISPPSVALVPSSSVWTRLLVLFACFDEPSVAAKRSEEHTSELQSPYDLVCRLLLEKKKNELVSLQHINEKNMNIKPLNSCKYNRI